VLWRYGYDGADQLTRAVKHDTDGPETILQRYAYAYDPAGNRTVEQIDDAVLLSSHDALNRLLAQAPGGPLVVAGTLNEPGTVRIDGVAAAVDAAGAFRGTVATTAGTTTFTVAARDAAGNETTATYEVDVAGTGRTFTYDANGNLVSDGERTFEWDARNQLVAVTVGTHRSEFMYDGLQRRVRHTVPGHTDVGSVWCDGYVCEERDWGSGTQQRVLVSDGEWLTTGPTFLAADHLGSVWSVTSGDGSELSRYAFDPWGRRSLVSGADVTLSGYASMQPLGDLWLTKYRSVDPGLARWISEDPAGLAGGSNFYRYVSNDPIAHVDPLGLFDVSMTWKERIVPQDWIREGAIARSQVGAAATCWCVGSGCDWRLFTKLILEVRVELPARVTRRPSVDKSVVDTASARAHEYLFHLAPAIRAAQDAAIPYELRTYRSESACLGACSGAKQALLDAFWRVLRGTQRYEDSGRR
jgi:RHS repeat-associated protein